VVGQTWKRKFAADKVEEVVQLIVSSGLEVATTSSLCSNQRYTSPLSKGCWEEVRVQQNMVKILSSCSRRATKKVLDHEQ